VNRKTFKQEKRRLREGAAETKQSQTN